MEKDISYKDLYSQKHLNEKKYRTNNQGLILYDKWCDLISENDKIIDLGCGNGILCDFLSDRNYEITGVDVAASTYDRSKYGFIEKDLINTEWNFSKEFDVALCFDVLEHFDESEISSFLDKFFKICKKQIFSIAHYGFTGDTHVHKTVEPLEWWLDKMDDKVKVFDRIVRKKSGKNVTLFYREEL